jgi:hypothetical protein
VIGWITLEWNNRVGLVGTSITGYTLKPSGADFLGLIGVCKKLGRLLFLD